MKLPLEGIKVLDFSWVITGPLATKFLGDFGAEVIKVESQTRPDEMRMVAPFKDGQPGMNRSGGFTLYNSSKRDITLNLNKLMLLLRHYNPPVEEFKIMQSYKN